MTGGRIRIYVASAVLAVALSSAAPAAARTPWPQPAAGDSASEAPELILTFDDGPHERFTLAILDELSSRDLKAIFFWVGHRVDRRKKKSAKRVDLVERAVREGHLVANHTINHVHLCGVPRAEAAREIDSNRETYEELTGLPISIFRAPYGDRCRRLEAMLGEREMAHLHWDIDPREFLRQNTKETAAHVIGKLRRLEGRAVLLMHDTNIITVRALPRILDWIETENELRRKGGDQPPIRILTGSDLVAEKETAKLGNWSWKTASRAADGLAKSISRLIPGTPQVTLSRR